MCNEIPLCPCFYHVFAEFDSWRFGCKSLQEPKDSILPSSTEDIPALVQRHGSYHSESGDEICKETISDDSKVINYGTEK